MPHTPLDLPGSFYARNGRWWWCVRFPGTPKATSIPMKPDGQQYATTDLNVAKTLAMRVWARAEAEARGEQPAPQTFSGSFLDFRARVLKTTEANYGKNSNVYVRADLATRWCLSEANRPKDFPKAIQDIRASHLEALMRFQAKGKPSRTTINQRMEILVNKLFRYAARDGLITPEQYGSLTLYEPLRPGVSEAKEPKVVTSVARAIVDTTLQFAPQTVRDMVDFQALTGARSGELCRMSWSQIDSTREVWFYVPAEHKTKHKGKVRVIGIGPKAQKILERYRHRPTDAPIFSARQAMKERNDQRRKDAEFKKKVTKGVDGYSDQYDSYSYRQAVDYAIDAARKAGHKIPAWHPHQLRHQMATGTFLQLGQAQASAALGHSGEGVTMIYVDKDARLAAQMKLVAEVASQVG